MTTRAASGGQHILAYARAHPGRAAVVATAAGLGAAAIVNGLLARRAERRNRPVGRFLELDGVRLHYLERGQGEPLVLLHGNGSMIEDFAASGLIDMAAKTYRVIAFDRPGFGHSSRPRGTVWTPLAQARLLHAALERLAVSRAILLGHSWGASVAVAFGMTYPEATNALVLASGYYFPTARADAPAVFGLAVPGIGDVLSHTVAPVISRVMWPLSMRKLFAPAAVPGKFRAFPREMAVRPSQIRAGAAEAVLMIPEAFAARNDYATLRMPVVIVAGAQDRVIDIERQSARLHRAITQSTFHRIPNAGHMVHQTSTGMIMAAVDEAAEAARQRRIPAT